MFNLEYIRHAETFCALQVPIYYYVKTKGSLATQSLTIPKTIKMKLTVFEYYNRFFKTVLDEEEYEKSRLKVYKFLLDAAGDGAVPPAILPGSQKLGNERMQVSPDILAGGGILYDAFRDRKLLERYLETAALKNDLTLPEAAALLYLHQCTPEITRRELADFAGLSRSALALALQKAVSQGLVRTEERKDPDSGEKQTRYLFTPAAGPVLEDLEQAQQEYETVRLDGLTAEERTSYLTLSRKIQTHIQSVLE